MIDACEEPGCENQSQDQVRRPGIGCWRLPGRRAMLRGRGSGRWAGWAAWEAQASPPRLPPPPAPAARAAAPPAANHGLCPSPSLFASTSPPLPSLQIANFNGQKRPDASWLTQWSSQRQQVRGRRMPAPPHPLPL